MRYKNIINIFRYNNIIDTFDSPLGIEYNGF